MKLKKKNLRECPTQLPTSALISLDPLVISLHAHKSAPRKLHVGQTGICIKIRKGLQVQSKLGRESTESQLCLCQDLFFKKLVHDKREQSECCLRLPFPLPLPPVPPPLSYFMGIRTLQISTSFLWKVSSSSSDLVHLFFVLHTFFSHQLMTLIGFCFNVFVNNSMRCPLPISFFVFVQEIVSIHNIVLQTNFFIIMQTFQLIIAMSLFCLCFLLHN